jgi:hypothetical protein
MWDFVMDKSSVGASFLRELRFPLPIYIPSASPQSSSTSPEAGTIGQEWPQCQQLHKPHNNNKKTTLQRGPITRNQQNGGSKPGAVLFVRCGSVGLSKQSE